MSGAEVLAAIHGDRLFEIAARAIRHGLDHGRPAPAGTFAEIPQESYATFVTLERDGALRGCIGSVVPHRPVADDVAHNAYAAAFHDPRFSPLTLADWPLLTASISILGPMEFLPCANEADLLSKIRPGIDGLVIAALGPRGMSHGLFLPQVWKVLPNARDFVAALWVKAGLAPKSWPDGLKIERFTTAGIAARALARSGSQ